MRFLLSTLVICGLAGGALFLLERGLQATQPVPPAGIDERREALGVRRMLTEARFDFSALVIGIARDDLRDFRGSLREAGRVRPVYGQARRLCVKGLDAADCWEIGYLQVDGRQVLPAEDAATPIDPAVDLRADDEPAGAPVIETADVPAEALVEVPVDVPAEELLAGAPVADGTPRPAATETVTETVTETTTEPATSDTAPPAATHKVARPVINTRDGPGTDNAVVTRLNAGARLALVERTGEWGRFVVLDGAESGTEVWAALRILEALE